jgi:hypothetical protein
VQAWQPVHFSRSMTIPHFAMMCSCQAFWLRPALRAFTFTSFT